ncbi:phage major capsid protein [Microlunatus sp. Y2014]|uniref:phage major capsid protein n=1 Tax=Microlunatus sp. Y2014 TaxID=3418488 RepID=UPI003DA708A5
MKVWKLDPGGDVGGGPSKQFEKDKIMDLIKEFNDLLIKMQALASKAGNLTATEATELKDGNARLAELKADIERAKESSGIAKALQGLIPEGTSGVKFIGLRSTRELAKAYTRGDGIHGMKAVVDNAEVGVPSLDTTPVTMGKPPRGLLDVMPSEPVSREYAYYRQVTRTNNAAFVAPGGTKPTSVVGLERIEGRLRVLAHLSESVDKYLLEDMRNVEQFIADELLYGLRVKLEDGLINGDGVGENVTGLANTSGVQVQEFVTDAILTARAALTKIELLAGDDVSAYYVMHPTDWEKIETARLDSGQYLATTAGGTAPIDRVARRLWGAPVVLSASGTGDGTSYLVRQDAVTLMHDGRVNIEWDKSQGFDKNEVKARVEGRFDVAVKNPLGVVKIALAGV